MTKKFKRSDIARLWQEKQSRKQAFDEKSKNTKKQQSQIDALYTLDNERDKMIEKYNIIELLDNIEIQDTTMMQDILDRTGNALQLSINSYDSALSHLDEIEKNQGFILNEVSSSFSSGGTITSGVLDLSQTADINAEHKTKIVNYIEENKSLDRSSLQEKLDHDLNHFDPELFERRKHAWDKYNSGVDQDLRDCCTHMRELIYYFLNRFCKNNEIIKCDWYDKSKKEPGRWDQINYLLKELLNFPENSSDYGHLYNLVVRIKGLLGDLSSLTHFGPKNSEKVYQLIIDTEDFLIVLFSKGLEPFRIYS